MATKTINRKKLRQPETLEDKIPTLRQKKKGRKSREIQTYLDPSMEPPKIPEIEKAANAYISARDERMSLTEEEVEMQGKLLEAMKKHELFEYRFNGQVVKRIPGDEKVKVRTAKDDKVEAAVEPSLAEHSGENGDGESSDEE